VVPGDDFARTNERDEARATPQGNPRRSDTPIPVIDLARLMDNSSTTCGHDVVVIRATTEAPLIGLLVDELAGIPAIAVSRMLPMSDATQRAGPAIGDRRSCGRSAPTIRCCSFSISSSCCCIHAPVRSLLRAPQSEEGKKTEFHTEITEYTEIHDAELASVFSVHSV
jgi:hypothetical protein